MARPRGFDEQAVIQVAAGVFATQGFNGTSIDDLVNATGLMRGSLYKAFGSKRNLFHAALQATALDFKGTPKDLDLITVALKELASEDKAVATTCHELVTASDCDFGLLLGENLLEKMKGTD